MTELEVKPTQSTTSLRSQLSQLERWRKVKVNALLVLVTMIWGSTFLIVQHTLTLTGPFTFLALRFSIGAIVLAGIFHKRLACITSAEIIMGSIIGVFLFATYALQTTGLQYISSSKAGFITGLYVPLVAILAVPILHQKPTLGSMLGVALSQTGILLAGEPFVMPPLPVWGSALFMGVVATAFALAVMNRVQQFVSSTQATLIYALELVWVGMLGYVAGDQLSLYGWIGCSFILLGMVAGELRLSRFFKRVNRVEATGPFLY